MLKMSMKELNEKLSVIMHVVVHPKYWTISLGTKLVRETSRLLGLSYIESIAVMPRYNPFFEKAGIRGIMERFPDHEITEAIELLR